MPAKPDVLDALRRERDRLAQECTGLRRAIELLHKFGNLSRESLELEAVHRKPCMIESAKSESAEPKVEEAEDVFIGPAQ